MAEISTERLIMRGWRESDLAPWAAMNADPEVRQYLGPLLTFEQASAWVLTFQDDLDRYGFGFWAVEVRASGEFIGFTGLGTVDDEMPFTGVEVGWRLARPAWGHGYATEAALAALEYGFDIMGLPEIVAVTMARNLRSQAVMRRIGMTSDPAEDFDDPDIDEGPLRRHVVYRKLRDLVGKPQHRPPMLPDRRGDRLPVGAQRHAGRAVLAQLHAEDLVQLNVVAVEAEP
jgi:RimJ/RimL family protein N-acetyltransferase